VPFGQPFVVTATVSAVAPGGGTPTGTVQFSSGGENLGPPVALTGGQASITINMILPKEEITADYSGATGYQPSSASATPNVTFSHPTVSGSVPGAATYNGGTWLVSGANIGGNVTVGAGTSVLVMNSTIGGAITATNSGAFALCGTSVGAVTVSGASGFVLVGDPGDDGCAGDTLRSNVRLSNNTGGVELGHNQIGGAATVTGNSGRGAFPEDVTTEIEANVISGALRCGNTPVASDDNQPNTVYGARSGECTGTF
jgi:hypothetical protein